MEEKAESVVIAVREIKLALESYHYFQANVKQYVVYICGKVSTAGMTLARLTPNVGGPRHACRILIDKPTLLYTVPVWKTVWSTGEQPWELVLSTGLF